MTEFQIVRVPQIFAGPPAFQAHCDDGRTYHGSAKDEDEFRQKVIQRLLAEEADEAPYPA